MEIFTVPKEFISAIIGPGGKIIQGIQEKSGANVSIEEIDGEGRVEVSSSDKAALDKALSMIRAIVAVPEVGEVYDAKVTSVMPYGLFVEFMPGKDGLLHISEIDWRRFEKIEDTGLQEGDSIRVQLLEIDPKTGKYRLSHRSLLPKPEGWTEPERPARRPRSGRDGEHHGDRRQGGRRSED